MSMQDFLFYFGFPFLGSLCLTPLVRSFARAHNIISYPRQDRWHKHPTALLGGIAIFLAAIIPLILLSSHDRKTLGLIGGGTLLFLVGLADDKFHFAPYTKLFAQLIAGSIAVLAGISIGMPVNQLLSVPLTLLWIVGITNAFNLLDNIDGLAAGIAAIAAAMLFITSVIFAYNPLGPAGLVLAGAALGFLPYNFNPAKIFMGDSGSMFLGYSLAVVSISGTSRHLSNLLITLFIPVLILCVPIFDTLFVMIGRTIQGKKIFEGGKDHTSHRLVTLGLSPKKAVVLMYAVSIVFGLIALSYLKLDFFLVSIIAFLGVCILIFFGHFLFEGTSYKAATAGKPLDPAGRKVVLTGFFMHKRRILEVVQDFLFVCTAYYAAYFLRFEGGLLASNLELLKNSLLWIILIKMSVFFAFGLYRGVWRYIGISDFFTIFKVCSIGSLFSVLFLTFVFRFKDYSRAVFIIDWLILLLLLMGSRFLLRMIVEFFSRVSTKGKRVLIFGAGDIGEMVVREMRRDKSLSYCPVGFVDDDPRKTGIKIHGVPVMGTRQGMEELIQKKGIEELIIAISSISPEEMDKIVRLCKEHHLTYRKVKGILE